jgi:hypothetical protein
MQGKFWGEGLCIKIMLLGKYLSLISFIWQQRIRMSIDWFTIKEQRYSHNLTNCT